MTANRIMIYTGEFAVALGAGIKDGTIGSFLMVIGLCAIVEGIITLANKGDLFSEAP